MNTEILLGGISICLGVIIYNKYFEYINYNHDLDISIYEVKNMLSDEELNNQFDRDFNRYNLDLNISKIIKKKPEMKIFFTQTIYNYIYLYYLVPNIVNKKYNLFDKTYTYKKKKNIMQFENNLFIEERYFDLMDIENENIISTIKSIIIYKYPSNILTLNISYNHNINLFNFNKNFII